MKTQQINYLAILAAAVAIFMLGAIWYTVLCGQAWQQLTGITDDVAMKNGVGFTPMIISFVTYLLAAYAMAVLFKSMGVNTLKTGAMTGALIGALLIGGNIFSNNAYEMKPVNLSIINAGFSAVSCAAMGAILGAWKKYST
jgi:hypothetical protein